MITDEMVERAARAAFEVDALPHWTWDEVGADRHDKYNRLARAALTAALSQEVGK